MSTTQLAAIFGFAFAAVWLAGDFGDAVLCLIAAAIFALASALARGQINVERLRDQWERNLGGDGH